MPKILIVFAHPRFETSRANRALLSQTSTLPQVRLHDLYEQYPAYDIDVAFEQTLLADCDIIVWHFPFYLYGAPALFKQWMDTVLEHGWAHGAKANALAGKLVFVTLTAGGTREGYALGGQHRFTIGEFLAPFEQTAALCNMVYLPPFVVHGTHRLDGGQLALQGALYARLLATLSAGMPDVDSIRSHSYLNDWLSVQRGS